MVRQIIIKTCDECLFCKKNTTINNSIIRNYFYCDNLKKDIPLTLLELKSVVYFKCNLKEYYEPEKDKYLPEPPPPRPQFSEREVPNCEKCFGLLKSNNKTYCRPQGYSFTNKVYGSENCKELFNQNKQEN